MRLFCLIKHKWSPVKTFWTSIVDENGKQTGTKDSWTGYECHRCRKKKIIQNKHTSQSSGATQNAYDWLNEEYNKSKELNI